MTDPSPSAERPAGQPAFAPAWPEIAVAAAVIAIALASAWQTFSIPKSPLYSQVGPTLAPHLVWVGLLALGLALLATALRGGWQGAEERETAPDRVALGWLAAGLVLNVVLIGPAGFTVASVVLFTCVARAFGSRRLVRDVAIGLVLALVAYFGFARGLGLDIGQGPVERAILDLFSGRTGP